MIFALKLLTNKKKLLKMEQTLNQIERGKIFILNQKLLAIYEYSNFFLENAVVLPDENTWLTALSNDGTFAVHNSEQHLLLKCKDAQGNIVNVIKSDYSYIRATNRDGNYVYFTNESAAEAANFKFSFRLGGFHDSSCTTFYGDEKILTYHTSASRIQRSKLKKFHDDNDEYLLGLEVEKCDYPLQQSGDAWQLLEDTGWSKEMDGSLGNGGFELVSPILPLFNTNVIETVCQTVKKWIDGDSDSRCGGHITISNKNLTGDELLQSFKHFVPIIYALYPNRITNNYCKAKQWSKLFTYNEKYQSFYIKDRDTKGGRVEIRVPSRVRNLNTLLWRIKLVQMLIKDNCNLNQLSQKIGCPESAFYKLFAEQYSHIQIVEKLRLIDKYAKSYCTHKSGLSLSVKKRINSTMSCDVFNVNESNS